MSEVTKATYFLGVVKVPLSFLSYRTALSTCHREESKKAKSRLLKVFELEGCRRYEEEHFIDAKIDRDTFVHLLSQYDIDRDSFKEQSQRSLLNPVQIRTYYPCRPITCLNGLHRVRAAEEFLEKNDQWWIVRLYESEGFADTVSTRLLESFSHEQHYSDGTIFRKIRIYHEAKNDEAESRWWARLTDTKRKDLRQLLKIPELIEGFDRLLIFPGLWTPIQLGTLHRFHALKCHEELSSYLQHIFQVWRTMIPEDASHHVDTVTVRNLELYAPGKSKIDASAISILMEDGLSLFPNISDADTRADILRRILSIQCIIPSLRTFFENQKYFEPCCSILRTLLDSTDQRRSLWRAFSANYFLPEHFVAQYTETESKQLNVPASCWKGLGYMQLWLFCLRNFPEMTNMSPRMGSGLKRKRGPCDGGKEYNPALWHRLGKLAVSLGFKTPEALRLSETDPVSEQAAHFLRAVKPGFAHDNSIYISRISTILAGMKEDSYHFTPAVFTTARDPLWGRDQRCGRPYDRDHESDKEMLFLPRILGNVQADEYVTSLFGKRDMLHAFLSRHWQPDLDWDASEIEPVEDSFFTDYDNHNAHDVSERDSLGDHQQCTITIATLQERVKEMEDEKQQALMNQMSQKIHWTNKEEEWSKAEERLKDSIKELETQLRELKNRALDIDPQRPEHSEDAIKCDVWPVSTFDSSVHDLNGLVVNSARKAMRPVILNAGFPDMTGSSKHIRVCIIDSHYRGQTIKMDPSERNTIERFRNWLDEHNIRRGWSLLRMESGEVNAKWMTDATEFEDYCQQYGNCFIAMAEETAEYCVEVINDVAK